MLGMRLAWPKIIGAVFALLGIGTFMSEFGNCLRMGLFTHPPVNLISPITWFNVAVGVSFIILSYPLWRARNWARVALLIVYSVICLADLSLALLTVRDHWHLAENAIGPLTSAQFSSIREAGRLYTMMEGGDYLSVLSRVMLVICLLCHPDVVRCFKPQCENTPSI